MKLVRLTSEKNISFLSKMFITAMDLTHAPVQWLSAASGPGIKRLGSKSDCSLLFIVKLRRRRGVPFTAKCVIQHSDSFTVTWLYWRRGRTSAVARDEKRYFYWTPMLYLLRHRTSYRPLVTVLRDICWNYLESWLITRVNKVSLVSPS